MKRLSRQHFFLLPAQLMVRVSIRKAANLIFEMLGPLCVIASLWLFIPGIWLLSAQVGFGVPVAGNGLAITFLASATILLTTGLLMIKTVEIEEKKEEESYLLPPLTPPPSAPKSHQIILPKESDCPSCGYTNHHGSYFCEACNTPLWGPGTPKGPPPAEAEVEKRRHRIMAIRLFKRRIVIAAIVTVLVSPLVLNLTLGYLVVSSGSLTVNSPYFENLPSTTNGTLLVYVNISCTVPCFDLTGGSYYATINNSPFPSTYGAYPVHRNQTSWEYNLAIGKVSPTEVKGSTVQVTYTGIAHYSLYYQSVKWTGSAVCGRGCV